MIVDGAHPGRELFFGRYASLAWAAITLVTLGAFANRSISTILPVASRELDALGWFGVMSSMPMLMYLVAGPMAGAASDRRSGRAILGFGVAIFGAGVLACAVAPSAAGFILGRALSGVGEAAFDVALVVVIAARIPETHRPKLFAAYSTAWLVPSALGPQVAAWIDGVVGWRGVFGSILVALVLSALILAVALRGPERHVGDPPPRVPLRYAWVAMGGGIGLAATSWLRSDAGWSVWQAGLVGAACAVAALAACLRLSPRGILRMAGGLPSVIALSAVMGVVFESVTAYLPLYVTYGAGVGVPAAGAFLTVTGVCWAVGSWIQGSGSVQRRSSAAQRVRVAFLLLAAGVVGLGSPAVGAPLWIAYCSWAVAGVGMGLGNSTLTTARISLTPQRQQGSTTAGTNLLVSCGTAGAVMLMGLPLERATAESVLSGGAVSAVVIGGVSLACAGLASRVREPGSPRASG